MPNDEQLKIELSKLELPGLKRLATLWSSQSTTRSPRSIIGMGKAKTIRQLLEAMQSIFHIRGVLEKLSATQTRLYMKMLDAQPEILTLGQLSKFISMPVKNTEMELNVLKKYSLIFQRKNRERLTNNLDKCYPHLEISQYIKIDPKEQIWPLQYSLAELETGNDTGLETGNDIGNNAKDNAKDNRTKKEPLSISHQSIVARLKKTTEVEKELLCECLDHGGTLEINNLRHFFQLKNMLWEKSTIHLLDLGLLIDQHFFLGKLIRFLIIPEEVYACLEKDPFLLLRSVKKNRSVSNNRHICNDLDFYLNIKKLLLYICKRELGLAQSGKIKQIDFRETERILIAANINLFVEKSQIHQIELLLPIMSLLKMVRVKGEQIVLKQEFDQMIRIPCMELLQKICDLLRQKSVASNKAEQVFRPQYMDLPSWAFMKECMDYLSERGEALLFMLTSVLIKRHLVKQQYTDFNDLQNTYIELQKEFKAALFYLQLFGFIYIQFPERILKISQLGAHVFYDQPLEDRVEEGGIILNSDLTLLAIPEKLSIHSLTLLKAFAKLESFEDVYSFTLSKESFQEGLLLQESKDAFIDLLQKGSRQEISQSLTFEMDEWSAILPIVRITDDCVLVQTKKEEDMQLLLNNIRTREILIEILSDKAISIQPQKIGQLIQHCEKLNLIVKLTK